MATIMAKAKIPRVIHSQSKDEPFLPISAPVMAIITAPPTASDMIFIADGVVNGLLDLRVFGIAYVTHGLRKVRRRNEKHVDVRHGQNLVEVLQGLHLFE